MQVMNEVKVVRSQCDVVDQLVRGHDLSNGILHNERDDLYDVGALQPRCNTMPFTIPSYRLQISEDILALRYRYK